MNAVVSKLETAPAVGPVYESAAPLVVRRLLMPRSRYHVYYSIEASGARVLIHAVWHASRGQAPRL